jgi:conjugal transfer pilus assembly protein TraB
MLAFFKTAKRKQQILTILIIGLIVVAYLFITSLAERKPPAPPTEPIFKVVDDDKLYEESFRSNYGTALSDVSKELSAVRSELDTIKKEKEQDSLKTNGDIFEAPPMRGTPEEELAKPTPPDPNNYVAPVATTRASIQVMSGLIVAGSSPKLTDTNTAPATAQKPKMLIPSGSFVRSVLLSGVTAPTMGQGVSDPVPVLIRVTDEVIMPNLRKADLKECFVLADVKGNLATESASMRLTTLSCIKNDNTVLERKVRGFVAGENGMEGLQGRVVSKQGTLLGRVLVASFLEGVAEAFRASGTSYTISPSGTLETFDTSRAAELGMFSGAEAATKKLAEFYMELVSQMVPVIEINAGRVVELVFLSEVNMEDSK